MRSVVKSESPQSKIGMRNHGLPKAPSPKDIEDVYELSPMQQGMLFHTLEAPQSGTYCVHVAYRLRGPLDRTAFVRAWEALIERHAILRTSFHWEGRDEPIQRVHVEAPLPVSDLDWRDLSARGQDDALEKLLVAERRRDFPLTEPPLLRLTLIRLGDELNQFVLSHHHLLLDGWCKVRLFEELFSFYEAFQRGKALELPPPPPYRDYISWLREQDLSRAECFWRRELADFRRPTPLWARGDASEPDRDYAEMSIEVAPEVAERLQMFGRKHRLTLNTILQGVWGLLLAHAAGTLDVVFGATVSGRPPSLPGAESMMGLFINTLPVRVRLGPESAVIPWLSSLQLQQARARDYDYAPLSQIRRWSEVKGGWPLFESILVFENNLGYGSERELYGDIELFDARAVIRNSLPLTLRCVPGRKLSLQLLYDCRRFSAATVAAGGEDLATLLVELPRLADRALGSLVAVLEAAATRRREKQTTAVKGAILQKLKSAGRARRKV